MLKLTKGHESKLWKQHVGTGVLIIKTGPNELMSVEVFIRPRDGILCRICDGKPALPIDIDRSEEN